MAGDTGLMRRGGRSGIEPLGRECAIIDCVEGIPVRHSAIRHSDVLGADGREERARVWAGRQPADWAGIASREAFESGNVIRWVRAAVSACAPADTRSGKSHGSRDLLIGQSSGATRAIPHRPWSPIYR